MIWLVGNRGMLGTEVESLLRSRSLETTSTDLECDITDRAAVFAQIHRIKPKCIVNCAAYTAVDRAEDEREFAFAVNSRGVENIGLAANECGASVLHVSTDYVFDGCADSPYDVDAPLRPLGVYGESKADGEGKLLAANPNSVIVRTAWLYGLHGNNFVATMLRLMSERDEISVVSDQVGSPTYASDFAELLVRIATDLTDDDDVEMGIYHFTNDGVTSWYEFAREIQRQAISAGIIENRCLVRPIDARDYPTRAKRPTYSVLYTDRVRRIFCLKIRAWQVALADYLSGYPILKGV
jgi:dTDP-4-dehydrorhamnose reductase